MLQAKSMRCIVHEPHQLFRLTDDGCPVTPGKNGGKKGGNFNVLFFGKPAGDGDGVVLHKRTTIVFIGLPFQEFPDIRFLAGMLY